MLDYKAFKSRLRLLSSSAGGKGTSWKPEINTIKQDIYGLFDEYRW